MGNLVVCIYLSHSISVSLSLSLVIDRRLFSLLIWYGPVGVSSPAHAGCHRVSFLDRRSYASLVS
jgi:hypothetical protein